jgi:hypothetical protein
MHQQALVDKKYHIVEFESAFIKLQRTSDCKNIRVKMNICQGNADLNEPSTAKLIDLPIELETIVEKNFSPEDVYSSTLTVLNQSITIL